MFGSPVIRRRSLIPAEFSACKTLRTLYRRVRDLTRTPGISRLLRRLFDNPASLVRATLFDKTEGANWGAFWYRDLSVAVKYKIKAPGFSGWTQKAGVTCVQPPVDIMRRIRAVHIHLDDCGQDQRALRVLPRTHRLGHLNCSAVEKHQTTRQEVLCEARADDAVVICPMLLHASSPMSAGRGRRVIHLSLPIFPCRHRWSGFTQIPPRSPRDYRLIGDQAAISDTIRRRFVCESLLCCRVGPVDLTLANFQYCHRAARSKSPFCQSLCEFFIGPESCRSAIITMFLACRDPLQRVRSAKPIRNWLESFTLIRMSVIRIQKENSRS